MSVNAYAYQQSTDRGTTRMTTQYQHIIPATGAVEFTVHHLTLPDEPPHVTIDGPTTWRRPVVGLGFHERNERRAVLGLHVDQIIVDEHGDLYAAEDYLDTVFAGGGAAENGTFLYHPDGGGPFDKAPKVQWTQVGRPATDLASH
jgi:hypothetical protein